MFLKIIAKRILMAIPFLRKLITLVEERDTLLIERNALVRETESFKQERDTLIKERDTLIKEIEDNKLELKCYINMQSEFDFETFLRRHSLLVDK